MADPPSPAQASMGDTSDGESPREESPSESPEDDSGDETCAVVVPHDFSQDRQYNRPALPRIPFTPASGLINSGCTCYFNSLLQTFFALRRFAGCVMLLKPKRKEEVGMKAQDTITEMQKLFLKMQLYSSLVPCSTLALTHALGTNELQQHDVNEVFTVMVDKLIVEMTQQLKSTKQQGRDEEVKDSEVFNPLEDLFAGAVMSKLEVPAFEYTKTSQESITCVSVPIASHQGQQYRDLRECLKHYTEKEILSDYKYEKKDGSKEFCKAYKGLKFSKLPPVLCLNLNRFQIDWSSGLPAKLNHGVDFQRELDMRPFYEAPPPSTGDDDDEASPQDKMGSEDDPEFMYDLFGVFVHVGPRAGHGHYFVYIRNTDTDSWVRYDDETVTHVMEKEAIEDNYGLNYYNNYVTGSTATAYFLVYVRRVKALAILSPPELEVPTHLEDWMEEEKIRVEELKQRIEINKEKVILYLAMPEDILKQGAYVSRWNDLPRTLHITKTDLWVSVFAEIEKEIGLGRSLFRLWNYDRVYIQKESLKVLPDGTEYPDRTVYDIFSIIKEKFDLHRGDGNPDEIYIYVETLGPQPEFSCDMYSWQQYNETFRFYNIRSPHQRRIEPNFFKIWNIDKQAFDPVGICGVMPGVGNWIDRMFKILKKKMPNKQNLDQLWNREVEADFACEIGQFVGGKAFVVIDSNKVKVTVEVTKPLILDFEVGEHVYDDGTPPRKVLVGHQPRIYSYKMYKSMKSVHPITFLPVDPDSSSVDIELHLHDQTTYKVVMEMLAWALLDWGYQDISPLKLQLRRQDLETLGPSRSALRVPSSCDLRSILYINDTRTDTLYFEESFPPEPCETHGDPYYFGDESNNLWYGKLPAMYREMHSGVVLNQISEPLYRSVTHPRLRKVDFPQAFFAMPREALMARAISAISVDEYKHYMNDLLPAFTYPPHYQPIVEFWFLIDDGVRPEERESFARIHCRFKMNFSLELPDLEREFEWQARVEPSVFEDTKRDIAGKDIKYCEQHSYIHPEWVQAFQSVVARLPASQPRTMAYGVCIRRYVTNHFGYQRAVLGDPSEEVKAETDSAAILQAHLIERRLFAGLSPLSVRVVMHYVENQFRLMRAGLMKDAGPCMYDYVKFLNLWEELQNWEAAETGPVFLPNYLVQTDLHKAYLELKRREESPRISALRQGTFVIDVDDNDTEWDIYHKVKEVSIFPFNFTSFEDKLEQNLRWKGGIVDWGSRMKDEPGDCLTPDQADTFAKLSTPTILVNDRNLDSCGALFVVPAPMGIIQGLNSRQSRPVSEMHLLDVDPATFRFTDDFSEDPSYEDVESIAKRGRNDFFLPKEAGFTMHM